MATVLEILNQLKILFQSFCGEVTETSIRHNLCACLCILEEIVDHGVPQVLCKSALEALLKNETKKGGISSSQITKQIAGTHSWRNENAKHRRNEVYLDMLESLNLLMSTSGQILQADIVGQIIMKSQLSGTPKCKMALNHKQDGKAAHTTPQPPTTGCCLEHVSCHQCVRITDQDNGLCVSFIPPEGVFELMRYRCPLMAPLPVKIVPNLQYTGRCVEVTVEVVTSYPQHLTASSINIDIPMPRGCTKARIIRCSLGKASLNTAKSVLTWGVTKLPGTFGATLKAEVDTEPNQSSSGQLSKNSRIAPINVSFEIPMYTASGVKIRYLKVIEHSGYKATKWIRYMVKAGLYQEKISLLD